MTTLPCREAARLTSSAVEGRLGLRQRLALHLHLALCSACRTYRQQVIVLDRLFRTQAGQIPPGDARLSPEARQRLLKALQAPNGPDQGPTTTPTTTAL